MEVPKSPEDVDELIECFEVLELQLEAKRQELIALVDECGTMPSNATVSKRLSGLRKSLMVTRSSSTTVDEDGVIFLHDYLEAKSLDGLFPLLFERMAPPVYVPPPPKHRRVGDVFAVLINLPKRLHKKVEEKIAVLYAAAVVVRMNKPSLKVETVK